MGSSSADVKGNTPPPCEFDTWETMRAADALSKQDPQKVAAFEIHRLQCAYCTFVLQKMEELDQQFAHK